MRIKTIFILCFALLLFSGCANNKKEKVETSPVLSEIQKKYIDEGWLLKSDSSMDGELPSSYGVKPEYGLQDNYFDINMGEGCDIAVKIIDLSNDRCIRYIFVSENSSITINQIPQGQYYLKIAYGYDWMEKFEDGMTHGKFTRNCYYEKSVDVFDFGKKNSQHTINYILNINIQSKHPINDVYQDCYGVATFASNTKSHDDKGRGRSGDCLLRREQDQLQTAPVGTWD